MAKCVHEIAVPASVCNPFRNPFTGGATADGIEELFWVCGHPMSTSRMVECSDPGWKLRCCYYKPESVVNRMPERTEGAVDPRKYPEDA